MMTSTKTMGILMATSTTTH